MRYEKHIDLKMSGPVWVSTSQFQKKMAQARDYVRDAFNSCENPYLSISGGKDSIAMLGIVDEVAREMKRDFLCWIHLSDASFPGTLETSLEACRKLERVLVADYSPVSAFDVIGKQSKARFGKKGYFFDAVERMAKNHDLSFVGVRAAESKRRRDACNAHGHIFKTTVAGEIQICHPIKWFGIRDVAAAIYHYKLPLHPIYEKVALGSLPVRLGYATGLDLVEKGTVVFLKKNYPELFSKLASACPEVRSYL